MLVGTVDNTLAGVVVVKSKVLWKKTYSFSILVLAITDTLTLKLGMIGFILLRFNYFMQDLSDPACKSVTSLLLFLLSLEPWILVMMTLEHLVAVYLLHKTKVIFTKLQSYVVD